MNHDAYADVVTQLFPEAKLKAVARLTGGVSADVHRLDLNLVDGRRTSLVLRAHRASHAGHSAELEYQLLQALHRHNIPVPEPLLVDASGNILAEPFLVMAFVEGTSTVSSVQEGHYIDMTADMLKKIHALPTTDLPTLPARNDPLPEVFDYLPEGSQWTDLRGHLHSLSDTAYVEPPKLLHGDFWPGNLLWQNGTIAAVLDWEDAALGDPLSDVACCLLELRYKLGKSSMCQFTQAYARNQLLNHKRLALWQVYVAAAAQKFMGEWGLAPVLEAHMRTEAMASMREAGSALMGWATW